MKKFVAIILAVICAGLAAFSLAGCSDAGAPEHGTSAPQYTVSPDVLAAELDLFMEGRADRTTFKQGEQDAAQYLYNRLGEFGYEDVALQDFETSENNVTGLQSQNVVAHLRAERAETVKNVIIGAYYDNRYGSAYKGAEGDGAEAALSGGTGVAATLSVAQYLMRHISSIDPNLDVTIVFFGASYLTNAGARAFYKEMNATDYENTVLMIEMQRLGCDHIYAFSDARETKREKFFDGIAADRSLDIYKPTQKSPIIAGVSGLNGVPFYQWAHNGVFSVFFNENIPTLNLVGANWETINMADIESADHDNVSFSERDTLQNLKKLCSDYAEKMATAATLVTEAVFDDRFVSVMQYDKRNFPDTDVLTYGWIWYLVVVLFVIAVAAVMLAVCAHVKKKNPIVKHDAPQVKMAVFGMDYEDKNSGDIYIDVRDCNVDDDIFPGVQNNSPDPFDGIFPPFGVPHAKRDGTAVDPQPEQSVQEQEEAPKPDVADQPRNETEQQSSEQTDPFGYPNDVPPQTPRKRSGGRKKKPPQDDGEKGE